MTLRQRATYLSQEYFRECLSELAHAAGLLYERAAAGETMTVRDVAMAAEYSQRYIDILDEMLGAPLQGSQASDAWRSLFGGE